MPQRQSGLLLPTLIHSFSKSTSQGHCSKHSGHKDPYDTSGLGAEMEIHQSTSSMGDVPSMLKDEEYRVKENNRGVRGGVGHGSMNQEARWKVKRS